MNSDQGQGFFFVIAVVAEDKNMGEVLLKKQQSDWLHIILRFSVLSAARKRRLQAPTPYSCRSGKGKNTGSDSEPRSLESEVWSRGSLIRTGWYFHIKTEAKKPPKQQQQWRLSLLEKMFSLYFCLGLGKSSDCKAPWGSDAHLVLLLVPTRKPETIAARLDWEQKIPTSFMGLSKNDKCEIN